MRERPARTTPNKPAASAGQQIPPAVLLNMLDSNARFSNFMYFAYNAQTRQLQLKGALPNENVSSAHVKLLVDEAVERTHKTADMWYPPRWPKSAAGPAAGATP